MTNTAPFTTESRKLSERFIQSLELPAFPFDDLLRDIVSYQGRHNPQLAAFWKGRGFDSERFTSYAQIPAVPTDVFRHMRLVSNEAPPAGVFRTSGTTSGARGEHFYLSTRAYDAGALRHFQDAVLGRNQSTHFISVAFDAATHKDSSLSHMLHRFGVDLGKDERSQRFYFEDEGLREDALRARLKDAVREEEPVTLFGTAFGLADAMDAIASTTLPAGSKVIQTGGFKGRREALSAETFYHALSTHYGVPPSDVLAEYGMTELGSQLYSDLSQPAATAQESTRRLLVAPPWCRVDAVDPHTLEILPQGEEGLLRFGDCANIDSVAVIQTSDLGVIHPGGVELIGRSEDAVPRGCSLAIEEIRAINTSSST